MGCSDGMKKGEIAERSDVSWSELKLTLKRVDPLRQVKYLLRGERGGLGEQTYKGERGEERRHGGCTT